MNSGAEPKKDEKAAPKEEPQKPNSIADKIKAMNIGPIPMPKKKKNQKKS